MWMFYACGRRPITREIAPLGGTAAFTTMPFISRSNQPLNSQSGRLKCLAFYADILKTLFLPDTVARIRLGGDFLSAILKAFDLCWLAPDNLNYKREDFGCWNIPDFVFLVRFGI
jgi:hypothetical protein